MLNVSILWPVGLVTDAAFDIGNDRNDIFHMLHVQQTYRHLQSCENISDVESVWFMIK